MHGGGRHTRFEGGDCAWMEDRMADTLKPDAKDGERAVPATAPLPKEIGGPKGPEPTRYGDWEVKGRCSDF